MPPASHSLRPSQSIDSAYAQLGLARLVLQVRSGAPNNPGASLLARVGVSNSLPGNEQLWRLSDSTGTIVLDSLTMRSVSVRVSGLGYATHIFPLAVRPGHTDTIDVTLPAVRVCPIPLPPTAFDLRLQN